MLEEIPEEERPFILDKEEVEEVEEAHDYTNDDFISAVKRIIYGTESLLETIDEDWSEEVEAIREDIEEARKLWPKKNDL